MTASWQSREYASIRPALQLHKYMATYRVVTGVVLLIITCWPAAKSEGFTMTQLSIARDSGHLTTWYLQIGEFVVGTEVMAYRRTHDRHASLEAHYGSGNRVFRIGHSVPGRLQALGEMVDHRRAAGVRGNWSHERRRTWCANVAVCNSASCSSTCVGC